MFRPLLVLLALFLCPAVGPADDRPPSWVAPMRKVHARFTGKPGTLALFGDSITTSLAFWAGLPHAHKNMDAATKAAFDLVNARQRKECWRDWRGPAHGNEGSTTIRWAHDHVDAWLKKLEPEVAVVLFGTNDLTSVPLDEYEKKLRIVVRKCLDKGTVVILTTLPPRSGLLERAKKFAAVARKVAKELQVPLCDYQAEILKRRPDDWDGAAAAFKDYKGYDVPTLIARDGVHPSNPKKYAGDYSAEALRSNGYGLRNYLTLIEYAAVIRHVLQAKKATRATAKPLPNVVLIYADDLGYGDLGCYGARGWSTPNLDRLAKEGVRFTDFYVAQAVCSASRAALLTGCYPNRIGILGALGPASNVGISDREKTIGDVLKARGYATAVYGKWHLGYQPRFLPTRHGFDDYFGLPYSNDMWPRHPDKKAKFPALPLIAGEKVVERNPDQSTLTTRYTEKAVAFIDRNRDRPFFLYLPHTMPHVPLHVSAKYRGKSKQGLYGDVIMELDWSVGQVLGALKKHDLEGKTLVLFASDNGPWLPYGEHAGTAGPLREGKGSTWEGGVRVPFLARWLGHIPAGSVQHEPAMTIDILPTLAALTGAKLPDHPIDGKDIWPLLAGQKWVKSPHDAYFFWWGHELQAVRAGKWKLHLPHTYRSLEGKPGGKGGKPVPAKERKTPLALYDLDRDPGEKDDLAGKHPEVVKHLQALAEKARRELGDSRTKTRGKGVREPGKVEKKRPNVVFLLSDDQRFDTIAALGNRDVRTPNLDRLVKDGFAFTHAFIMGSQQPAVCVPSRAMLMTGRTLFHVSSTIAPATPTWPQTLAKAGYVTCGIGKWHNGKASFARSFARGGPVFFGGMTDQARVPVYDFDPAGKYAGKPRVGGKYSTELFADAAVEFLRSYKEDKPFALYVAFTSPHDPRTAPAEFAKMYDPDRLPLPKSFLPRHPFDNGELTVRDEKLAPWPRTPAVVRRHLADYYAMISHLDSQVGRILQALAEGQRDRDTLVVFAGDNGLAVGKHGLMGKQNLYDHSVRVPLLLAGPGVPRGGRSEALVYLFDLFPTLANLTGVPAPATVEGKSLVPILQGKQKAVRDSVFAAYRDVQRMVRTPRWKLIRYPKVERTQLFDLSADPEETTDLSGRAEQAGRIKEMQALLKQWQKKVDDPLAAR